MVLIMQALYQFEHPEFFYSKKTHTFEIIKLFSEQAQHTIIVPMKNYNGCNREQSWTSSNSAKHICLKVHVHVSIALCQTLSLAFVIVQSITLLSCQSCIHIRLSQGVMTKGVLPMDQSRAPLLHQVPTSPSPTYGMSIRRILTPLNIRTCFKPHQTLGNILVHVKDRPPQESWAGVVYQVSCSNCRNIRGTDRQDNPTLAV